MQRRGHPSLPQNPFNNQVVTAALSNPYAQPYSPHYAQAIAHPVATSQGYTYSSTYDPSALPSTSALNDVRGGHQRSNTRAFLSSDHPSSSSWYQPGDSRCTHKNCTFSGSHRSLETHMMDRHLIYPPGWDNKKKRPDWDADPSLKGCVNLSHARECRPRQIM